MSGQDDTKPYNVYVLIDTNIFFDDFTMSGKRFLALQNMIEKTNSVIIMPSVILDEIKKKYKERLCQQQEKIDCINEQFPEMITQNKTVDEILRKYETSLKRLTRKMGMAIVDSSKVDLSRLINRSLEERHPFGKKSKGFRDAVIWETTIAYLREKATKNDYPLVVITRNKEDFGADYLYDDLREDLGDRKSFCYAELSSFLDEHGGRIKFITNDLIIQYIENNFWEIEELVENVDDHELLIRNETFDFIDELTVEQRPTPTGEWGIGSCYIYKEDESSYYIQIELEIEVVYAIGSYREVNEYDYLSGGDYVPLDRIYDVENTHGYVDGVINCKVNKITHEIEVCSE